VNRPSFVEMREIIR